MDEKLELITGMKFLFVSAATSEGRTRPFLELEGILTLK